MNIETLCGDTRKDLGGSSFGFPNFDLFQPENTGSPVSFGFLQMLACNLPWRHIIVATQGAHGEIVEVLVGVKGRQTEMESQVPGFHGFTW